jgi:hypothetical protein
MAKDFKDLVEQTSTQESTEIANKRTIELLQEIRELNKQLESFRIVAYAQTNDRGDLFNLTLQNNPYVDQNKIVPLYKLD